MPNNWSEPDQTGVCTLKLDVGATVTLRGKRQRRAFPKRLEAIDTWPLPWRELLTEWLRAESKRRKWESLIKQAGARRTDLAFDLLDALLRGGWIEVEEKRDAGRWLLVWVEFIEPLPLRRQLGLAEDEATIEQWQIESAKPFNDPRFAQARASLDAMPATKALDRLYLLRRIETWDAENRFGTKRDFALFAGGDTKALSSAQWQWLEKHFMLSDWGIEAHAPVLWLRAPLCLIRDETRLELSLVRDCLGLTAKTLQSVTRIEGHMDAWYLVENRTSFERVAKEYGASNGVLWLPGFPPRWWKSTARHLLTLLPAPAYIACDPDPAGIDIAYEAGELWESFDLKWSPWMMDQSTLENLPHRKALNDYDRKRLAALATKPLSPDLKKLVDWMIANGEKGEQEGAL